MLPGPRPRRRNSADRCAVDVKLLYATERVNRLRKLFLRGVIAIVGNAKGEVD